MARIYADNNGTGTLLAGKVPVFFTPSPALGQKL